MKTITEILDDPRTERIIQGKLQDIIATKSWRYFCAWDLLSPTTIIYQYKRQQAHESALPSWIRSEIHVMVTDAIEEVLEMERTINNKQK